MKATIFLSALGLAAASPISRSTSNITNSQADAMSKVSAVNTILASSGDTENGLSGPCKAVTVIFAKGTGESGNVGDGSSPGPAWFTALESSLGIDQVAVQGVAYDASVIGYLVGGDPAGTTEYLRIVNLASTQCPSTKLVLGGYSQGGQLLHNAAKQFSAAVTAKVAAAVIFGDPDLGDAVGNIPSSKVDEICHTGDIICSGSGGASAHLTYANDAAAAAAFVAARV